MLKTIAGGEQRRCRRAQVVQNAMTHELPINIDVGDYMIMNSHTMKEHKLR